MADQTPVPHRLDGTEGLTLAEAKHLRQLEARIRKVEKAAGEQTGDALREIRDRRLYRAGHSSFESYCLDVWGFSVRTGNRRIALAVESADHHELTNPERESAGQSGTPRPTSAPISQREAARRQTARRRELEPIDTTASGSVTRDESAETGSHAPEEASPPAPPVRTPSPPRAKPQTMVPEGGGTVGEESAVKEKEMWGNLPERMAVSRFLAMLRSYDPAELGAAMSAEEGTEVRDFAVKVECAWEIRNSPGFPRLRPPTVRGGTAEAIQRLNKRHAPEPEGKCHHPVSRRLGDGCGQCGEKVKR